MNRDLSSRHASGGLHRRGWLCCTAALGAGLFSSLLAGCDEDQPLTNPCLGLLPPELKNHDLVRAAFDGIDATQLVDTHAHLLGTGDSGSGCSVHPNMNWHPVEMLRKRFILNAACAGGDGTSVDRAYVQRLAQLMADFPAGARWWLFAFERAHSDTGQPAPDWTTVHVPDAYTQATCRAHAPRFAFVPSIHPYAEDALTRLDAALAAGAVAVKWLPSAMNIDLRDRRCQPFYARLKAAGVPLVVHCGEEKAVPGARREDLVNPLLVRVPLQAGASVVVAHAASLGAAHDTDLRSAPELAAFDLFMRLVREADQGRFEGRLLADISAVFQTNREPEVWRAVLGNQALHSRLLHGSDYPLPGLMPLFSLNKLVRAGLLAAHDTEVLKRIRTHNPLLFDFVLKRSLRLGSNKLPAALFEGRALQTISRSQPEATA
jgi:uncharacterized protein